MFQIKAFNNKEWSSFNLENYEQFSDKITEINQEEIGDCLKGVWYYIPDEPLSNNDRVIYVGTFGNYNAPGADSYTYANIYNMDDDVDAAQFVMDKTYYKNSPEFLVLEDLTEDEDKT